MGRIENEPDGIVNLGDKILTTNGLDNGTENILVRDLIAKANELNENGGFSFVHYSDVDYNIQTTPLIGFFRTTENTYLNTSSIDFSTTSRNGLDFKSYLQKISQAMSNDLMFNIKLTSILNKSLFFQFNITSIYIHGNKPLVKINVTPLSLGSNSFVSGDGYFIDVYISPSKVKEVFNSGNILSFPTVGKSGVIYIENEGNSLWRWSGTQYVSIGGGTVGFKDITWEELVVYTTANLTESGQKYNIIGSVDATKNYGKIILDSKNTFTKFYETYSQFITIG